MNRYLWILTCLLGIMPVGLVAADSDPATALSQLAIQRRDAARKTYQVTWTNYRERRASLDTLYRWSLRWLEAESQLSQQQSRRIAARKDHWERMRELEKLIRNLRQSRQTTIDEASATEYYRVEAEIWLLQAKEKNR